MSFLFLNCRFPFDIFQLLILILNGFIGNYEISVSSSIDVPQGLQTQLLYSVTLTVY